MDFGKDLEDIKSNKIYLLSYSRYHIYRLYEQKSLQCNDTVEMKKDIFTAIIFHILESN